MSDLSSRLSLPLMSPAQAQKHVTHNEALRRLDAIVQIVLLGIGLSDPPADAAVGDMYALGATVRGAWAGHGGQIAVMEATGWAFVDPVDGWQAWDAASGVLRVFAGGDWQTAVTSVDRLGIGTTSSAENPLAVAGPNTLLTHSGAGHRLKINKAAKADTASLLFQSGWSGRAEMGLAGTDALTIKVSANGGDWYQAVTVDPADKSISFAPNGAEKLRLTAGGARLDLPLTGSAVTSGPTDATGGRVLRVGAGHQQLDPTLYRHGNAVGQVSQTGGIPTGALIESGNNANGAYSRFAGGLQICAAPVTLTYEGPGSVSAYWTFPAGFPFALLGVSFTFNGNSYQGAPLAMDQYGAQQHSNTTESSVKLSQFRIPGEANFTPSSTISVRAIAIGRWH